jgi:hypothetical protein
VPTFTAINELPKRPLSVSLGFIYGDGSPGAMFFVTVNLRVRVEREIQAANGQAIDERSAAVRQTPLAAFDTDSTDLHPR